MTRCCLFLTGKAWPTGDRLEPELHQIQQISYPRLWVAYLQCASRAGYTQKRLTLSLICYIPNRTFKTRINSVQFVSVDDLELVKPPIRLSPKVSVLLEFYKHLCLLESTTFNSNDNNKPTVTA